MEGLSESYVFWDASQYVLDLKKPRNQISELKQELSEKPSRPSKGLVDIKQYKKLISTKDKISTAGNWEKWSKLVNPYEKISSLSNRNYGRDYYKMYEIVKFYNLPTVEAFLCLCEAPGAFARALSYFNPKAEGYVSSYYSHGAPEFNDPDEDFKVASKGDLTDYDNIETISEWVPKCEIITADGSFDTKYDPNNQEQLSLHLIFSEILTAILCQAKGGTFILKMFDTFTRPTAQVIYLMSYFYEDVSLFKPRTSRITNSEKYLVARNFKGLEGLEETLEKMKDLSKNWDREFYCRNFGIEIPESFEKHLKEFNHKMIGIQITNIDQAIEWSCNEEEVPEKQIEAYQNIKAVELCSTFGINTSLSMGNTGVCKHFKKTKIIMGCLKNVMVCEKCLILLIKP